MTQHASEPTRVLVTGGYGFLGRTTFAHLDRTPGIHAYRASSREYDLQDPGAVDRLFQAIQPEVVVHTAAHLGGIDYVATHPATVLAANLAIDRNVVTACTAYNVRRCVAVGSAVVYPPPEGDARCHREEDINHGHPQRGVAAYGYAKRTLARLLEYAGTEHGLRWSFLIMNNLFGPDYDLTTAHPHVIPAIFRKMADARARNAETVPLLGSGEQQREFLYVPDAAQIVTRMVCKDVAAETVNLPSNGEMSIKELARLIAELVGYRGTITWSEPEMGGATRRCLDTHRFETRFGEEDLTPFAAALTETIASFTERFP